MKLFMCFGGAAPVADEAAAEQAACRQGKRAGGRSLPSFRWRRFFPGKLHGKKKRPSLPPLKPAQAETKKRGTNMDDLGDGGVFGAFTESSSSSSRRPNSASSLYSYCSSSPSSTPARSSGAVSCSLTPTASGALSPAPQAARRQHAKGSSTMTTTSSPAAGAVAVVLCLIMVVLCGRVGATLLTPTALYLFPWRWLARSHRADALDSRFSATQWRRRP